MFAAWGRRVLRDQMVWNYPRETPRYIREWDLDKSTDVRTWVMVTEYHWQQGRDPGKVTSHADSVWFWKDHGMWRNLQECF